MSVTTHHLKPYTFVFVDKHVYHVVKVEHKHKVEIRLFM